MSEKRYTVMNASGAMLCVNLDTRDGRNRRAALMLMVRERSRPMTEAEFASAEVQKLLATGDLRDMTLLEAGRAATAGDPPQAGGEDHP